LPESDKAAASHAADFDPPLYNVWKQQEKTNEQIGREATVLLEVERERAKRRQQEALKQGEKKPVRELVPTRDKGRSRDAVGAKVGVSGLTAQRSRICQNISLY
jgi:hypothetical protein